MTQDDARQSGDGEGRTGLKRILKNVASGQIARVAEIFVFLALIPFITQQLGTDQYGVWGVIWAIVSLFSLVDAGFTVAVVKFVSDSRGRRDEGLFRQIVATLFWVFVAQSAILLAVSTGLYLFFDEVFKLPHEHAEVARSAFAIVAAGALLRLPLSVFRGVLHGDQQVWLSNTYDLVGNVAYAISVYLVLPRWPDLRVLACLNLMVTTLPVLMMAVHCAVRLPNLSVRPRYFDRSQLTQCWNFASAFMVIHISTLIGGRVDVFIVQAALPISAVALYVVALRVSGQAMSFCSQVTGVLTPIVAELHGAGEEERLKRVWLDGSRYAIAFAAPLMIGCAVLAKPLIWTWVGPEFDGAVLPMQLLLFACLMSLVHGNSHVQLSMRGEQQYLSWAMIFGQVMNLVASMLVVRRWGMAGVALATLLAPTFADVAIVQRRVAKKLGVSSLRYYATTIGPSVGPIVGMLVLFAVVMSFLPVDTLIAVAVLEAAGAAVFWGLFWIMGMRPEERARVRARFARSSS